MHKNRKNIILTGFMGTGKTTVGKVLATRLEREFIDTDTLIEQRQGRTIPEIFSELGESAFRRMEADLAKELGQRQGLVISTGGRFMLDPENVKALSRTGRVFCLVATPQQILTRITRDEGHRRPLLEVPDPSEQIVELLQVRKRGYQRFLKIKTSDKSPDQVVEDLLDLMARTPEHFAVDNPAQPYECIVGNGILPFVRQLTGTDGMMVVITDARVGQLYGQSCGDIDHVITIAEGRSQKTMATVQAIYDRLIDLEFDRSGTIVALGGSIVGDVAGFVAGTYMRGVNFVQCPTSLLAMADTSIGGKIGIDVPQGKNLIGIFKQPAMVIADVATLQSLPAPEFASGMAEIIKHGLLADSDLFERLESGEWALGPEFFRSSSMIRLLVAQSVQVKIAIVQEDPFEYGKRSLLNLGHTFAHAIEHVSGHAMRHGEAVAIGLVASLNLSARLGFCPAELQQRVEVLCGRLGLPTRIPQGFAPAAIQKIMGRDKKRLAGSLRLVLLRAIGRPLVVSDVRNQDIRATLEELSEP
ncbi:MAG: 3-dehydroquinate synthase [Desulfoprunum sp.]|jgi:3-dehydroquinate synthase|uniref:3-dehydroquinate synthase n=1 Tax=Desulfoprunum sp. TaxID=2020866 RepID=UPI003C77A454